MPQLAPMLEGVVFLSTLLTASIATSIATNMRGHDSAPPVGVLRSQDPSNPRASRNNPEQIPILFKEHTKEGQNVAGSTTEPASRQQHPVCTDGIVLTERKSLAWKERPSTTPNPLRHNSESFRDIARWVQSCFLLETQVDAGCGMWCNSQENGD